MKEEKIRLRQEYLARRNSLSPEDIDQKSKVIIDKLLGLDEFRKTEAVMCYISFGSEVATRDFVSTAIGMGKRVGVPKIGHCSIDPNYMDAVEIKDIKKDLCHGRYGIPEPSGGEVIPQASIDMVVVPGLVFDLNKNRIGYGKGYYDRFLTGLGQGCRKIALAFEIQLHTIVPTDCHDVALDMIITEDRIIL